MPNLSNLQRKREDNRSLNTCTYDFGISIKETICNGYNMKLGQEKGKLLFISENEALICFFFPVMCVIHYNDRVAGNVRQQLVPEPFSESGQYVNQCFLA